MKKARSKKVEEERLLRVSKSAARRARILLGEFVDSKFPEGKQRVTLLYTKKRNEINLFFSLEEFSSEEIANTIGLISELYKNIGGDEIIIEKSEIRVATEIYEPTNI